MFVYNIWEKTGKMYVKLLALFIVQGIKKRDCVLYTSNCLEFSTNKYYFIFLKIHLIVRNSFCFYFGKVFILVYAYL